MTLAGAAFRTVLLILVWSIAWVLPVTALGGGLRGAEIMLVLSFVALLAYAVSLEFLIQQWILPRIRDDELSRQIQQDDRSGIRVQVIVDLRPEAYLVRSWLGRGTLVITQGLVLALRPAELELLVRCARLELGQPSLPLRSFGAVGFYALERLMGQPLRSALLEGKRLNLEARGAGPLALLRFQLLYIFGQALLRLTGPSWRTTLIRAGRQIPAVAELIARLDRLQRQYPSIEDVPLPGLALVGRSSSRTLFPSAM